MDDHEGDKIVMEGRKGDKGNSHLFATVFFVSARRNDFIEILLHFLKFIFHS